MLRRNWNETRRYFHYPVGARAGYMYRSFGSKLKDTTTARLEMNVSTSTIRKAVLERYFD